MKKIQILTFVFLAFFMNSCDNKSQLDESIVAPKKQKVGTNFDSKIFKLKTINDKDIVIKTTLSGLKVEGIKDKMILIDVFASWCPPCVKSIPTMKKLQKKYKDDLLIISVLFEKDKPKEEIKEFIKKHKIDYMMTVGKENFKLTQELGNISKVPEFYLYDKNGNYIKKFIGENDIETFESYIRSSL